MKNKKLSNLKLENKTVGLRVKLGILAIVFVVIAAGVVSATIRLKDPSGSTSGYWGDGSVITSNNGVDIKSWVPTSANLKAANWFLNGTGGIISLFVCNISISTLSLGNNVTLEGIGNASQLYLPSGTDDDVIQITGKDDVTIRNLRIDGNREQQTANCYCIDIQGTSNRITVENCYIHNAWGCGLRAYLDTSDVLVTNCYFVECGHIDNPFVGCGVVIQGDHSAVVNSFFNNCSGCGIAVEGNAGTDSEYITIMGNTIYGENCSHGIHTETAYASHVTISGNTIYNLSGALYGAGNAIGMFIGSPYTTVSNNLIDTVDLYGIQLSMGLGEGANLTSITSNIIRSTGLSGIILTGSEVTNVVVSENTIENTGQSGIYLVSDTGNNTVCNNQIVNCNTGNSSSHGGIYEHSTSHGNNINNNFIHECYQTGVKSTGYSIVNNNIIVGSDAGYTTKIGIRNAKIASGNKISYIENQGIYSGEIISSNNISHCGSFGIYFYQDSYGTANSNNINSCLYGIYLSNADNITIDGNICINNDNGDGIRLATGVNCTITSNRCSGNTGYGIKEMAGSDFNIVGFNNCLGNTAGAIDIDGSNTKESTNHGTIV